MWWFKHIESHFITTRNTLGLTKYQWYTYVVAAMESEVLQQISDIFVSFPPENYTIHLNNSLLGDSRNLKNFI